MVRQALACAPRCLRHLRMATPALLITLAPCPAAAATFISAVDVEVAPSHTRIVFQSAQAIRFSLFSLRNPERILLDLEGAELNDVLAALSAKVGTDHPYIRSVRVGQFAAAVVRVEFQLKVEADPHISSLRAEGSHPHRLRLDIVPARPIATQLAEQQPTPPVAAEAAPAKLIPPVAVSPEKPEDQKPTAAASMAAEELWLEVRINEQPAGTALFVRTGGRLLVSGEELRRWRLLLPDLAPVLHGGEAYYPLDALRGLSYRLDDRSQTLIVQAAPGLFGVTDIKGRAAGFVVPATPPPGGFLNYDVFGSRSQGHTTTSGLLELGAFGGWGVGTSSFLAQEADHERRFIRLDTTWTRDWPEELASLRMGDAFSGSGSWGRPVRFGGVQWATNFSLQPGFISFPLPGVSGEAVLPSTVDLYVNDALRMRRDIPTGPFSIQDLPVITGRGEARLVVRDLLGRERVIIQPYYATSRLLQQGLHDFSYESGFVREDFGLSGNDYGRFLTVGTHRLGLTDRLTGELRGELLRDQQTIGTGATWLLPDVGVFTGSIAGSRGSRGAGTLLGLGFERQTRWLSFGGNVQLATEHFSQVGLQPGQIAPRQLSQAFASLSSVEYGSIGLNYTNQVFRDREEIKFVTASYGLTLGKLGFLSLSVLRFLSGDASTVMSLTFTRALDDRTSASVSATAQGNSEQAQLQVQRSLPAGTGIGYRLLAGAADSDRREAGISLQNEVGTYTLEAAQLGGDTSFRGGASGGLALLGGSAYLSRRINDSFGVVHVPDYPNVRIYADNQPIATTGEDGSALLPRLRPYEKNSIRVEQADLPLDAQIDAVELQAVPYFRSGLLLQFPVRRSRGALLTVHLENGEPLPAGAIAQIVGEQEEFPVGLRGEVYLTGLASTNRLRISWRGQSCQFTVPFPDTTDPVPHLGTYICTGVKP